ncbi:hypothetical protein [Pedobacter montanisoli]|uniref:DUF3828 domain-containing protein n=1 Tax=Pedobacter montanisoli TaxID=2923277 RepID=A0ABS9ZTY7_9SPHI|nr:hypothetical protein [Pedobacter montanisoli]MCJ0741384.1 hypothetical protein [Pedobacter montanisoli]
MKKFVLIFICSLAFNICWGQKPVNNSDQEGIKNTIIEFLRWYKQQATQPVETIDTTKLRNYIIEWQEIDTLIKPTVNMIAVENYLDRLRASHCLSETFINNLRQYHQKIKSELKLVKASPKSDGIYSIPGLNFDVVFGSFEPEGIYDRYKSGIFRRISIVHNKAIVQFYIPQSSTYSNLKMLFTLTKEKGRWLIDYIGYYHNHP